MREQMILHEISPLQETDSLYIADRRKLVFSFPIHNHAVYELNFVEHAQGVRRIVGDHSEIIGDYDLVLITSPDLEHVWEQGTCTSKRIREITIQFHWKMDDGFLARSPFDSIRRMMQKAQKGLAFPLDAIIQVYTRLTGLSKITDRFWAVNEFFGILYDLSCCEDAYTLATSSYAKIEVKDDSKRILKVKSYINEHYMDEISLGDLASLANMSTSAFSRFFKLHTGITLREYIINIRLGHAARLLLNTEECISNISYFCGFNNISNFNRIFKDRKGYSPSAFREQMKKTRVIL